MSTSTSDSTEPTPSGRSLASLTERLKSKTVEDAKAIQEASQTELTRHRENLQSLSKDVASTTLTDMQNRASQQIAEALGVMKSSMDNVTETYQEQGKEFRDNLKQANKAFSESTSAMKKRLKDNEALIQQQAEQIKQIETHSQTKAWKALKIKCWSAIGVTVVVCMSLFGISLTQVPWAFWGEPTVVKTYAQGNYRLLTNPTWAQCPIGNRTYPCKPTGSN